MLVSSVILSCTAAFPCRLSLSESDLYVSRTRITSLYPSVKVMSLSLKFWARSFTLLNVPFSSSGPISLFDLVKTIRRPYKFLVSFRSTIRSQTFNVCFLLPDINILLFCFLTGAQRLISPLIRSATYVSVQCLQDLQNVLLRYIRMCDEIIELVAFDSKWLAVSQNSSLDFANCLIFSCDNSGSYTMVPFLLVRLKSKLPFKLC